MEALCSSASRATLRVARSQGFTRQLSSSRFALKEKQPVASPKGLEDPIIAPETMAEKGKPLDAPHNTVIVGDNGPAKIVYLNRPEQLNALNLHMVETLYKNFKTWNYSSSLQCIILQGLGGKAFCAGGDIKHLHAAAVSGNAKPALDFFRTEYKLNYIMAKSPKVTVASMNGITMGGGVGISIPCQFRVASSNTTFAMPETAIGFFPDVGGSYYLSRLNQNGLGVYLGLTGARIKGSDLVHLKLCTHYMPAHRAYLLWDRLSAYSSPDRRVVGDILSDLSDPLEPFTMEKDMPVIQRCFANKTTVEDIFAALEAEQGEFAKKTLATLKKMSPLSLKVTLKQITLGAGKLATGGNGLPLEDCFKMEYRVATRMLQNKDFAEGVRALLIDKDQKPAWSHKSLAEVSKEEVDAFFQPVQDDLQLPEETKDW